MIAVFVKMEMAYHTKIVIKTYSMSRSDWLYIQLIALFISLGTTYHNWNDYRGQVGYIFRWAWQNLPFNTTVLLVTVKLLSWRLLSVPTLIVYIYNVNEATAVHHKLMI